MKNFATRVMIAVILSVLCLTSVVSAKESLLIIRTEGEDFKQAVRGLREQAEESFHINEMVIDRKTSKSEIAGKMNTVSPKIVVLMDNISVSLYKKYQKELPASAAIVPSVSVMASFMDLAVRGLKNAAGIFYEVPLVTSMVNLRTVSSSMSFDKAGVVHRGFMEPSVRINREYCAKEHIKLVAYQISDKGDIESELKNGLEGLRENMDVLWVPNDNKIVNAKLLKSVWIPFARKFQKPIIVGVEVLVSPEFQFGTFGVIPDHIHLGAQAAGTVFEVRKNGWQVKGRKFEPPGSVYKIINYGQAERLFKVDKEKLLNVADKIL